MHTKSNTKSTRAQGFYNNTCSRITYIERGSLWESIVRFHHRTGGFYELSARDVRYYLELMFCGGAPFSRLIRYYEHARRADCLITHYA